MTVPLDRLKAAIADRYTIERELGSGGMATVYLARDLKHGREVAIKVLRPELAATVGHNRFLREIEIAAKLTHPNILPLLDSGDADGVLYYAMPYVEGESLADRMDRESQLSLDDALVITQEVADALSYAHARGVVHRDIKPGNILLSGGHAVVADFGIAKAVTDAGGDKLTETGLAVGTPAYMSPEQAGAAQRIDGRSDIYSLACVFYEMVVGQPPFTGPSAHAILARHAMDPVPPPSTVRPTIPPSMDRAVAKALAKVAADRYATAQQFAEALMKASTEEPVASGARSRTPRLRWLAATAVLLIGGGWFGTTLLSGSTIERMAVLPTTNLTGNSEQDFIAQGIHSALINELGQIGVTVVGRTSVMRYRNGDTPTRDIAHELSVDAVVESAVFRAGDTVGIEARLIDGSTEAALWTGTFDTEVQDVVAVVRGVAGAIASEIRLVLTPQAEARLATTSQLDPEAYEAFLKGEQQVGTLTPAGLDLAMQLYEEAIRIDGDFAEAFAGIGRVWANRQQMGLVPPYRAAPDAKVATMRALQLDSTLSQAHAMLAIINAWYDWDWEAAERSFRGTLELDPGDARTRAFFAHFLSIMQRPDESAAQMDSAIALDPYDILVLSLRGVNLLMLRRYEEAVDQANQVLELVPGHPLALNVLRAIYPEWGRYEDALEAVRWEFASRGDQAVLDALEQGYAESGYIGAMTRAAEELVAQADTSYISPTQIFELYLAVGAAEDALFWMEKAFDVRDPQMPYIGANPIYDQLRGNPRYEALLRRMRLPMSPAAPASAA